MKMQKSIRLFEEAQKYLCGGVNSPVRAFKAAPRVRRSATSTGTNISTILGRGAR
jgi:glutamate-1-semialdehyde aminotransferase